MTRLSLPELVFWIFGFAPVALVFLARIANEVRWTRRFTKRHALPPDGWYESPDPAPMAMIGGSTVTPANTVATSPSNVPIRAKVADLTSSVRVHVLRCEAVAIGVGRWQLGTTFLLFNDSDREIVLDDVHTRLFERNLLTPKPSSITYMGEVKLRQDNTLLKEDRVYSLPAGDGFTIKLLLRADRVEGDATLGSLETNGPILVVFGLVVDVYSIGADGIDRAAIPADRIHVFKSPAAPKHEPFAALDAQDIEEWADDRALMKRLSKYLVEHRQFRAVPRP